MAPIPEPSPKQLPLHLRAVRMSEADYVTVNFWLWRTRPRTRLNHWLLGAAVLLLGISLGLDVQQHGTVQNWSTAVFLVVALLYAAFRMALVRYQLRRAYVKNTAAQQPIDVELAEEGIRGHGTLGSFSSHWKLIRRAVWVEPHWLLLYPAETACYYLDLRCLRAPATTADVEQLLRQQQVPQPRV